MVEPKNDVSFDDRLVVVEIVEVEGSFWVLAVVGIFYALWYSGENWGWWGMLINLLQLPTCFFANILCPGDFQLIEFEIPFIFQTHFKKQWLLEALAFYHADLVRSRGSILFSSIKFFLLETSSSCSLSMETWYRRTLEW